jgi:hypothetical protein
MQALAGKEVKSEAKTTKLSTTLGVTCVRNFTSCMGLPERVGQMVSTKL